MSPHGIFSEHAVAEALFDALPDVVFFVKGKQGRYVVVNQTLADRCADGDKLRLIGKRPSEVFPAALAASYTRQDETVLSTGKCVDHQLELHIYPGRITGWCLTTKHPLRGATGTIIVVCVLAAPEGIELLRQSGLDLAVYTASLDERLNETAFIVPGLGDAGDRQFGSPA